MQSEKRQPDYEALAKEAEAQAKIADDKTAREMAENCGFLSELGTSETKLVRSTCG